MDATWKRVLVHGCGAHRYPGETVIYPSLDPQSLPWLGALTFGVGEAPESGGRHQF